MSRNTVPSTPVPMRVLPESASAAFASDRGGVRRIIASDRSAQVLYGSGLHPTRLLHRELNVIIECRSGEWFALDPSRVNVGHSGGGPLQAITELQGLGVSAALADQIAHSAYSDVRFNDDGAVQSHKDTYPAPRSLVIPEKIRGRWTVILSVTSDADLGRVREWATYLDRDATLLPSWLSGARGAEVLVDGAWAVHNGFTVNPPHPDRPISIAIQQGRLTLWIACPLPLAWIYVDPLGYEVLDIFGFTLDPYRRLDTGPLWRRWIAHKLNTQRALLAPTRR